MKTRFSLLTGALAGVLCFMCFSPARAESPIAIAAPLKNITIDGNLDDWPKNLEKHYILNQGRMYGPTDIDNADLKTSPDLSPSFMVGYSPSENLIYLAVTVRDDVEKIGFGFSVTDGIEMYIEGDRKRRVMAPLYTPGVTTENMASMRYALCPAGGSYDYSRPDGPEPKNPQLAGGDISRTKTRGAYSRQGDISVYEAALEAYDRFPDAPARLVPGKIIGLDVVVNDVDGQGPPAWISWGMLKSHKFYNADTLGDIILVEDAFKPGTASGDVTNPRDKKPFKNFAFEVFRDGLQIGNGIAENDGKYRLTLPAGTYEIRPKPRQGVETASAGTITVKPGAEITVNLAPRPLRLPSIVEKSAAKYRGLAGYRDSTMITVRLKSPGEEREETIPYSFAFSRPNRLRMECGDEGGDAITICSDGDQITAYSPRQNRMMRYPAPDSLRITNIEAPV